MADLELRNRSVLKTCNCLTPIERSICLCSEDESLKLIQQRQQLNVEYGNEVFLLDDVLLEILLRLPVRDLLRLRCVCKSWCTMIGDPNFIKLHHRTQSSICKTHYGDIPVICYAVPRDRSPDQCAFYVALLSKQRGDVHVNLTPDLVRAGAPYFVSDPDPELFDDGLVVGVANGIVCLAWRENLGLWNPATREFKAIPLWRNPCPLYITDYYRDFIGFGYDSISNDFKILRGLRDRGYVALGYEVYSLSTNSWKKLRDVPPLVYSLNGRPDVESYLDGVCYWYFDRTGIQVILSVNFCTEDFKVFNPPQDAVVSKMGYEYERHITLYKDCLAFVVASTNKVKGVCCFNVWVATEFYGDSGIPLSWQHSLTIGPFTSPYGLSYCAFRMDGDAVLMFGSDDGDDYPALYNPSTGTFKHLEIWFDRCYRYVESLFPLSEKLVQS